MSEELVSTYNTSTNSLWCMLRAFAVFSVLVTPPVLFPSNCNADLITAADEFDSVSNHLTTLTQHLTQDNRRTAQETGIAGLFSYDGSFFTPSIGTSNSLLPIRTDFAQAASALRAVPEPSSTMLVSTALALTGIFRRKRSEPLLPI